MKHIHSTAGIGLGALFLLGVVGCGGGGGGGGDGSGGAAKGAWGGSTSTGDTVVGVVLDNGDYWFIYNGSSGFGGVQGTGDAGDDGSFTSGNGLDFNVTEGEILDVDVSAQAVAQQSLNGSLQYGGGVSASFTLGYDDNYDLTPSLATLAGTYGGTAAVADARESATVTVSASGQVSGTSASGCRFSGSAQPHASGNVYDLSLTFGGGVCTYGTATVHGIVYYDAPSGSLLSAAVTDKRDGGFIFLGSSD